MMKMTRVSTWVRSSTPTTTKKKRNALGRDSIKIGPKPATVVG